MLQGNIRLIDWSAFSPYFNRIDHVWDEIARQNSETASPAREFSGTRERDFINTWKYNFFKGFYIIM